TSRVSHRAPTPSPSSTTKTRTADWTGSSWAYLARAWARRTAPGATSGPPGSRPRRFISREAISTFGSQCSISSREAAARLSPSGDSKMSTRTSIPTALCGVLGPLILVASFRINPAPPAEATPAQLAEFATTHHGTIVAGGWMQGIGSLLIVLFALALVHLAGATHRLAGWITLLAGGSILMVSLVEVTFYLA